ncbi:hypothetical protein [Paracidovorax wautersii]|uniref:Uncharacterized protein n=1 Tax=Paracidovorax wautersii TaxID=1177982 RepID=A0A1I2GZT1_9BURK|nr:hypothetical protein [Paracidovorax wautersii]SFF22778.1 hypothetical protein SAMN04489711_1186 [Paracidovorax wautersii]
MPSIRLAAAALLAGLCASQGAAAACYVVYSADQQVIYRSQVPPVDLSRQLHDTLPRVAPAGSQLVFTLNDSGCELAINRLQAASSYSPVRAAPARPARPRRS